MNDTRRGRLICGTSLLSIAVALSALPAHAQDSDDNVVELAPIYVTGEKVVRDLKDTASSVEVITSEDLKEKAGKNDVSTAIAGTPNVIYTESVGAPIIRGQNTEGPHTGANAFFAGTMPRATINLDGHYLDYNEFYFGATSVWDVQSIEVFRGPQTTSQGANAIAGAIIVKTNDPTFTPEGAYQFELGNYNQKRASFMWSGPISDSVAVRFALDYAGRDTFIDYVGSTFVQNEIGQDFETINGRVKLLWQPAELSNLEVMLTYSRTDTTRPSSEGASEPYEDLESITTWMPGWHQVTDTVLLDANYDFDNGIVLHNQLQFSTQEIERRVGTPTMGDANIDRDSYSNETRLTFGLPQDTFSGVAGLYYAYITQDDWLNQGGISTFTDRKHNFGLYGELSWRFAERWTLTGGLRYQRDDIRRTGDVVASFANSDLDYDQSFDEVLPKISLAYEVSPDITLGGMVSKGYNPGGVSLDFVSSKEWEEFEAETVWNYELFTRARLLNDRLFLSGNLFYMDYKNAQHSITQSIGGVTYIHTINADRAEAYGLELSMDYRPTETLTLSAGAGLLHSEITEFSSATAYEGNEFARAPGRMLSLAASWDVNPRLNLGGQLRFVDGYYSDTANSAVYAIEDYTLVDLQASYQLRSGLEIYGFINNVFDERTPVMKQAARGDVVFTQASMTSPRMFGLGVRGTF